MKNSHHYVLQILTIVLIVAVLGNLAGCSCAQSTDSQFQNGQNTQNSSSKNKKRKTSQKNSKDSKKLQENTVEKGEIKSQVKSSQAPNLEKILELQKKIHESRSYFTGDELSDELAQLMGTYDDSLIEYPDITFDSDADEDYDTKGIKISFFVPIRLYGKIQNSKRCTNLFLDYSADLKGNTFTLIQNLFFISPTWGEDRNKFYVNEIKGTTVTFYLLVNEEIMKEFVKNKQNYKIQISIENLSFERPKTWGKYKVIYLQNNNNDCYSLLEQGNISDYYIEKTINTDNQPDKILMADLKTIKIINRETNEIVETVQLKNAEFPRIKENPERELSENEKILNGDLISISEYDLTNAKDLWKTLSSIAGKEVRFSFDWANYLEKLEYEYEHADGFDKKDIRKKINQIKETISGNQEFFFVENICTNPNHDYCDYIMSNYKTEGMELYIETNLSFKRSTPIKTKENILHLSLEDSVLGTQPLFMLTNEGKLRSLENTGIRGFEILARGGVVYCREEFMRSNLLIYIIVPRKIMNDIYENRNDYEVVVVFNNLQYDYIPTYGYLRYDYLRLCNFDYPTVRDVTLKGTNLDNKEQPAYFITDIDNPKENKRLDKVVTANLRCVEIRHKTTKEVIAKIVYE